MECNREEASRAKAMAEKKLGEKDAIGAKRLALKALKLYPELDGLSQFLATLEVYISSQERINGEVNWYRVLGITPTVDDDTIRQNYRKLALKLHPDKNKSVGADGAFKLVSEAWSCLSNKALRSAFDRKLNAYYPKSVPPPHFSRANTFWTLCTSCKTQFEYLRLYVNSNLVCQNCRQPFFAVEMPLAAMNGNGMSRFSHMQGQNTMQHMRSDYSCSTGAKFVSRSNVRPEANLGVFCKADIAGKVPRGVHDFKEPGACTVNVSSHAGFFSVPAAGDRIKKRRVDEHRRDNRGFGDSGAQMGSFETGKTQNFGKINQLRELSQLEIRNMLAEKAKKDIQSKLNSWTLKIEEEKGKHKAFSNIKKSDENLQEVADTKSVFQSESSHAKLDDELDRKGPDPVSMDVPDPDFHDFDKDRTEGSFAPNQVWAAYDEDDGMPRYYAMIHSVISSKPLRMRISWLNSKNNRELSPINWIGSGFFKTSGIFWIGKHEPNKSLNSFSHKVKWAKGARGTIQIYPNKGDVWAMYTNWSHDWNELTPDEVIHKYNMVEVLEDFSEDRGVSVSPLVKVAGFKTVFRRHSNSSTFRTIPKEELFRLSHRVPSYVLTGKEGCNVPVGCMELDPASMPLELLQVFTEVQVKEMEKSEVQLMEDNETMNRKTSAKKTEAEGEKLIVYKRKRYS